MIYFKKKFIQKYSFFLVEFVWLFTKTILYLHSQLRNRSSYTNLQGGLPEWLTEQFAKLSTFGSHEFESHTLRTKKLGV